MKEEEKRNYKPDITYNPVEYTEYILDDYTAIATANNRQDLENKAMEAFISSRRLPMVIQITDIKELKVEDKIVHYALAISFIRK